MNPLVGLWRVSSVTEHSCGVKVGSKTTRPGCDGKFFSPHAFTAPALAPALQTLLAGDPNATVKTLVSTLEPYVRVQPKNGFASKVKHSLLGNTAPTVYESVAGIAAYSGMLRDYGHHCVSSTIGPEEMKAVLVRNAELNYNLAKKNGAKKDHTFEPFDPDDLDFSACKAGSRFLESWQFVGGPDFEMIRSCKVRNQTTAASNDHT